MTKLKIKVTYDDPLDMGLDEKIRERLESIGAEWYAQGTNLETGVRDLAFDWDSEEIYRVALAPIEQLLVKDENTGELMRKDTMEVVHDGAWWQYGKGWVVKEENDA